MILYHIPNPILNTPRAAYTLINDKFTDNPIGKAGSTWKKIPCGENAKNP